MYWILEKEGPLCRSERTAEELVVKQNTTSHNDQSILVSGTHLGPATKFSFFFI
jgi:hypothetical protein